MLVRAHRENDRPSIRLAAQNGGLARDYQESFASLAA